MADYSEFPTTPTAWQEQVWPEPVSTPEGPAPAEPAKRPVDRVGLVIGVLFIVLAVVLMSGVDLSADWFSQGFGWVVLIGAGLALLVNELRRARRRH